MVSWRLPLSGRLFAGVFPLQIFRTSCPSSALAFSCFFPVLTLLTHGAFSLQFWKHRWQRHLQRGCVMEYREQGSGPKKRLLDLGHFGSLISVEIISSTSFSSTHLPKDGSDVNMFSPSIITGILPESGWDKCMPGCDSLHPFILSLTRSRPLSQLCIYQILLNNFHLCFATWETGKAVAARSAHGTGGGRLSPPPCQVFIHRSEQSFPNRVSFGLPLWNL